MENSEEESSICPHKNCGQKFNNSYRLKRHSLLHTVKKQNVCGICGKQFPRSDYLTRHMIAHSNEKPFVCNIDNCGKLFKRKTTLNDHQKEVHRILNLEYKCHICGKSFPSTKNLIPHIGHHTKTIKKPYQCSTCNRSFTRPVQLKKHMVSHHKRQERKKPSSEEQTSAASLETPQSICRTKEAIEKPWKKIKLETTSQDKFNVPETDSTNQDNLLQKPITMQGNSHKCIVCNLTYDQKYKLEKHSRLHAVEHLCSEMKYFYRNSLIYKCVYCPFSIRTKESFTQHLTKHFKDQFCECYVCNRIFINGDDLAVHLTVHFDEDSTEVISNSNQPIIINKAPESDLSSISKSEEKIFKKKLRKTKVYVSLEKNEFINKMALELLQNKIKNAVIAKNIKEFSIKSEINLPKNEIKNNGTFVESSVLENISRSKTSGNKTHTTDFNENETQINESCNISKTKSSIVSQTECESPVNRNRLLPEIIQKDCTKTQNIESIADTPVKNNDGNIKDCAVGKNIKQTEISVAQDKDEIKCENHSDNKNGNSVGENNIQKNEIDAVNDQMHECSKEIQTNFKNKCESKAQENQIPNPVECNKKIQEIISDDRFDENYVEVFVIQIENDEMNQNASKLVNTEKNLHNDGTFNLMKNGIDGMEEINDGMEESKNNHDKNIEIDNVENSKECESISTNIKENSVLTETVNRKQIENKIISNNSVTISKKVIETETNSGLRQSLKTEIPPVECIVLDDEENEDKDVGDLVSSKSNNSKNNLLINVNANKNLPRIENQAQFFAGKLKEHLTNQGNPNGECKNTTITKENVNNKCNVIRFNPNSQMYPTTNVTNQQINTVPILTTTKTKPAVETEITPTKNDIPVVELSDDDTENNNDKSVVNNKSHNNNKNNETTIISLRSPLPFITQHKKEIETTQEHYRKEQLLETLTKNLSELKNKLRELNIPISFRNIIFQETQDYVREVSNYDFSEEQLTVIRKIRKRSRRFLTKTKANNVKESNFTRERRLLPKSSAKNPIPPTLLPLPPVPSSLLLPSRSTKNIANIYQKPPVNILPAIPCPVTISFQHPRNGYEVIQQLPILFNSTATNPLCNNVGLTAEPSNILTTYGYSLSAQNHVLHPHSSLTQNTSIPNLNIGNFAVFNAIPNAAHNISSNNNNNNNGALTILTQPSRKPTVNDIP